MDILDKLQAVKYHVTYFYFLTYTILVIQSSYESAKPSLIVNVDIVGLDIIIRILI